MNDWSGMVTADSLPRDIAERRRANARLLQATYQVMPGNVQSVTLDTLSAEEVPRFVPPDSVDRFELSQTVKDKYTEFASRFLSGRLKVVEGFGPRAGGSPTALGTRGDDFPHSPGYRPRTSIRGLQDPWRRGQPRPYRQEQAEEEQRYLTGDQDYKRRSAKAKLDDDDDDAQERHIGLSCQLVHGPMPHAGWMQYVRAGGRIRVRRRG